MRRVSLGARAPDRRRLWLGAGKRDRDWPYRGDAHRGDAHRNHAGPADLPGRLFCPYPDPYYPLLDRPRADPCLFVQPNKYLAGHLLDKYAAVFGPDSTKVSFSS